MRSALAALQGKRVALLGYGVNHRAVVGILLSAGISVTVRDRNPKQLTALHADYPDFPGETELIEDVLDDLQGYDLLVRSPGIPLHEPRLQAFLHAGGHITSQTKLFFQLCPCPIVGVTGTKGKGTTCTLIQAICRQHYHAGKVYLGGNIGVDPCSFLQDLQPNDRVILELSSFQLQDVTESPQIAVILTVGTDHLDHHQSLEQYRQAKAALVRYQKPTDVAILCTLNHSYQMYREQAGGRVLLFDRHTPRREGAWVSRDGGEDIAYIQIGDTLDSAAISPRLLQGEHNIENILAACLVAHQLGIALPAAAEVVRQVPPLPMRLSPLGEWGGALVYNDSGATEPDATCAALDVFSGKRVHLILGGNDKGGEYGELVRRLADCASISLLPGSLTTKIEKQLPKSVPGVRNAPSADFARILRFIGSQVQAGDIILLSPAGSSFSSFQSSTDRGEQFTQAVAATHATGI
jgi:UDP-N-acetylmuramoylalanine--D-glutamate ligase